MPKPYDEFAERGDGGLSVTTVRGKTVYRAKKYVGLVEAHDADGNPVKRPKYISGQGDTRQAAKRNLNRNLERFYRLAEEERLLPRAERELTLASYYSDSWLPAAESSNRYKTADGLDVTRRRMEMHALPALGGKALRDLKPADIKTFIEMTLPSKQLKEHAVAGVRKTLNAVLTDALTEGKLLTHPMARLKFRGKPQKRHVHAPRGLVDALRSEVMGTQEESRWMLGLLLGPRPGEVLGLKWDAIEGLDGDIAEPFFTIRRQLKWSPATHAPNCKRRADGGGWSCGKSSAKCTFWDDPSKAVKGFLYLEETTKSSRIRVNPLTEPLLTLLREQRSRQQAWREAKPAVWASFEAEHPELAGLVFTTPEGRPRRQQADSAALAVILKKLREKGIDAKFSPHGTRHIAITQMALANVALPVVQSIVGHMDAETTDLYTHIQNGDMRDAVERIGESSMKAYKALEMANADAAREAIRKEAEAARQATENAYAAWKSERTGDDGVIRFDPRSDPHPPVPVWDAAWMPDEVAVALDQPGVKPDALSLFLGDLSMEQIGRYAPMGATDPAHVRTVIDDGQPDEYAKVLFA